MKNIALFVFVLSSFSTVAYADLCGEINGGVNHIAIDDVTYRPSPNVVPADINAVPIDVGDVEIPLTAYLVKELGLNVPVGSTKLGSVKIKENGQVIYNGKDISSNAKRVCSDKKMFNLEKEKEIKAQKYTNEDRQVKVEAVKSAPLDVSADEVLHGGYGQEHINKNYND